jgi:hypothetical protein
VDIRFRPRKLRRKPLRIDRRPAPIRSNQQRRSDTPLAEVGLFRPRPQPGKFGSEHWQTSLRLRPRSLHPAKRPSVRRAGRRLRGRHRRRSNCSWISRGQSRNRLRQQWVPGSYLKVASGLRIRSNRPSRPSLMCALCWILFGDQRRSAALCSRLLTSVSNASSTKVLFACPVVFAILGTTILTPGRAVYSARLSSIASTRPG